MGEEEVDARCQPIAPMPAYSHMPDHQMALVANVADTVDFGEPGSCYSATECDDYLILGKGLTHKECCCDAGPSWSTKGQCFKCASVNGVTLLGMCDSDYIDSSIAPETASTEQIDSSDPSYNYDDLATSMSDNYGLPNYDNGYFMESDYDDALDANRPFSDQPRVRVPKVGGREAPISVNVEEKIKPANTAFSCGLPGGCGNGDCIQSPRGVKCKCHKGWSKNRQGKCMLPI